MPLPVVIVFKTHYPKAACKCLLGNGFFKRMVPNRLIKAIRPDRSGMWNEIEDTH